MDKEVYLRSMGGSIRDKLRVAKFIPDGAGNVLDVGCADGRVTKALALERPYSDFLGIDLNHASIAEACRDPHKLPMNCDFARLYLRDLLKEESGRFTAVVFMSVLHEFYSYGEGISSVVKALADAHELLQPGGVIIIRDMIHQDYAYNTKQGLQNLWLGKIMQHNYQAKLYSRAHDFKDKFGLDSVVDVNHFILKWMYEYNWEHEMKENYFPVSYEQYVDIFRLLGMRVEYWRNYLLPYVSDQWRMLFDLHAEEMDQFKSTAVLVARKQS